MSDKPISDLRARMIADMTIRTFGEKTRHDYIRHVEAFARFLGRSPDAATGDDIRRFQLAQVEQGAQPPKMNTQASALPSLEAFGRRPQCPLQRRHGPSSETLHNS
jgi:integrase/recombinase XerD